MPDSKAAAIVSEALALHASHPHAPAIGVLDQVIFERRTWLEDFSVHMEPRAPFALLAAEAFDCRTAARWREISGPDADDKVRDAMRHEYAQCV